MEELHQLAELFQQAVTKSDNTSNSVAPPNITQTQQEPQAKIQTATTKHDAHPHRPNIIEDDDSNQPQKLTHKNQPLGLGLPPQHNTSTLHHIPPDFATYPRVTPYPRMEQSPRYQTQSNTRRIKLHFIKVRRCGKLYRNRGSKIRHSPYHRSIPRVPPPHKGRRKRNLEKILRQQAQTTCTRCRQPNIRH